MPDDGVMAQIEVAIGRLHGGDREGARRELERIWSQIKISPNPLHECALAHFMADLQSDVTEELAWDLRALQAAFRAKGTEFQDYEASLSVKGFLPSLYLNLADDYDRLGRFDEAQHHLALGKSALEGLDANSYIYAVRSALERLADRIEATEATHRTPGRHPPPQP